MLYYDRIDISEEIDVNKTSASKECVACHYQHFLNDSFTFQPNVCNRCYDLLIMSVNFKDIAILNYKVSVYWSVFSLISKNEAAKLLQNADITEKNGML